MRSTLRLSAVFALVLSMFAATMTASAQNFADQSFERVWERTDRPVAELEVSRTWMWGPGPNTDGLIEDYVDAPGEERLVQYFDKSRMELTRPEGDALDIWFVTQGLLATELITGGLQLGDEEFVYYGPAVIPVAGDPDDLGGPTYAAMQEYLDWGAREQGAIITQVLDRDGIIDDDDQYADYEITDEYYVEETEHNIASVFWDFINSSGVVYDNGNLVEAPLFPNPFYAVGYPITEAYWAFVKVDGVEQDVLLQ